MLIPLSEWAENHGVAHVSARQKAARGGLPGAIKIGRNWVIEEDAPNPDARVKSGKYVGQRKSKENSKTPEQD